MEVVATIPKKVEWQDVIWMIKRSEAPKVYKTIFTHTTYSTKYFSERALNALKKKDAKDFVESLMKLGANESEAFEPLIRTNFRKDVLEIWRYYDRFLEGSKEAVIKKLQKALGE